MRTVQFHEDALFQNGHFVVVDNGVEFVRDGDDGVAWESAPDDALD